jgi:pimeloyl-ACP methyl ester carboxylesterase
MKVLAADIAALLALLDCGPVIAVGHSMGAAIISALAIEYPERVSAAVCVDPGYLFKDEVSSNIRKNLAAVLADPEAMLSPVYSPATPAHLKTWHMRRLAGVPKHVQYQTMADLHVFGTRSASEPYLRRRACPVLAIYAGYDRSGIETPLFRDPRSRAFAWPGSGHWLHQERPAEFNAVVEAWLEDIGAPDASRGAS